MSTSHASIVVQEYLKGKTLDQIANETGLSKGKVHYLVGNWKNNMGIPNIDEIREFVVMVRKSGISIKQCSQGFRLLQLMKNLGIGDDNEDAKYDDDATNEISNFLETVYKTCKNLGIKPNIVPLWIKDLLECRNHPSNEKNGDQQTPMGLSQHYISDSIPDSYKADSDPQTNRQVSHHHQSSSPPEVKIPFFSQVSSTIAQKKKECNNLEEHRISLIKEIDGLELQIRQTRDNVNQISQKEKSVMSYLDWYGKLKEELWFSYEIKIEEDIQSFAKLINDFRHHGYDASKIMSEYLRALSLRMEIKTREDKIQTLQNHATNLNNLVLSLQTQVDMHRQTLYALSELKPMGFGMKELKQLWLTISEIAEANSIQREQAVPKFLKDVEEQYDRKIGFEDKVNSKRKELESLNNQIHHNQLILQAIPFLGPALHNLFQNGVSEHDIIGINRLAQEYKNNDQFPIDVGSDAKDSKHDKGNEPDERGFWRSLTDELKRYGGLKIAIKDQSEKLQKIKQEIGDSDRQRQEVLAYCQIAISITNAINSKIYYLKGLMDHYLNEQTRSDIRPTPSSPALIFVICDNKAGGGKGEKEEGEKEEK
jgi:predicted acetyltransferase